MLAGVRPTASNAASVGANTVDWRLAVRRCTTAGSAARTAAISVSNWLAYGPEVFTAMATSTRLGLLVLPLPLASASGAAARPNVRASTAAAAAMKDLRFIG